MVLVLLPGGYVTLRYRNPRWTELHCCSLFYFRI